MTDQHRATLEQWQWVKDVCHPDQVACILELRARVEALEAAQGKGGPLTEARYQRLKALTEGVEIDQDAPADSLVERVQDAIDEAPIIGRGEARAAIREVRKWLSGKTDGYACNLLDEELNP